MASGRPDWYGSMSMHGKCGDEYIAMALNELGHMITEMMGFDGVDLRRIAVDGDGIMKANLVLQEMSPFIIRETYGEPKSFLFNINVAANTTTALKTIIAKGRLYMCWWSIQEGESHKDDIPLLSIDGNTITDYPIKDLWNRRVTRPGLHPIYIHRYDEQDFQYVVGVTPGITFEESVIISYRNVDFVNTCDVKGNVMWSEI